MFFPIERIVHSCPDDLFDQVLQPISCGSVRSAKGRSAGRTCGLTPWIVSGLRFFVLISMAMYTVYSLVGR